MRRYTGRCEDAIRDNQAQHMVDNTSQIARLGNRVLMAAKNEADNSEEPSFVQRVNQAASQLHTGKASKSRLKYIPVGSVLLCTLSREVFSEHCANIKCSTCAGTIPT